MKGTMQNSTVLNWCRSKKVLGAAVALILLGMELLAQAGFDFVLPGAILLMFVAAAVIAWTRSGKQGIAIILTVGLLGAVLLYVSTGTRITALAMAMLTLLFTCLLPSRNRPVVCRGMVIGAVVGAILSPILLALGSRFLAHSPQAGGVFLWLCLPFAAIEALAGYDLKDRNNSIEWFCYATLVPSLSYSLMLSLYGGFIAGNCLGLTDPPWALTA